MTDRGKVIKSLEKGIATTKAVDGEFVYITVGEAGKALELMKEQEPVKPKTHNGGGKSPTWWYVCGACEHDIDPKDKFCRECGRKVKWDAAV